MKVEKPTGSIISDGQKYRGRCSIRVIRSFQCGRHVRFQYRRQACHTEKILGVNFRSLFNVAECHAKKAVCFVLVN